MVEQQPHMWGPVLFAQHSIDAVAARNDVTHQRFGAHMLHCASDFALPCYGCGTRDGGRAAIKFVVFGRWQTEIAPLTAGRCRCLDFFE